MSNSLSPRFIIAGSFRRDYTLTPAGQTLLDVPGGSAFYAAAGLSVWEKGIGLLGRTGEGYPHEWLEQAEQHGLDVRGVHPLPQPVDHRFFCAFTPTCEKQLDSPVGHFADLGLAFPKDLLDYSPVASQIDSRTRLSPLTIRLSDIPGDYLDASAAHLCPMEYLAHSLLPPMLRQGHITTLTMDASAGYMDPVFLTDLPPLMNGLTAFHASEEKVRALFQGRSDNLWEMAESLASHGCELIVIKRGERGQYLYDAASHTRWVIPAYPVHVVNPTGVGDAFCGGFLAGWRDSYDPLQAALQGNISASFVIEGSSVFYAIDCMPGLAEARQRALKEMVRKA